MSERYKYFGKYKVDRWIVQTCMFLVFLFLLFVAWRSNFELDYFVCGESEIYPDQINNTLNITPSISQYKMVNNTFMFVDTPEQHYQECKNPFYKPSSWKNQEYLPIGTYGTKPTVYFNLMWEVVFGVFTLGFVINHLIYNRRGKNEGDKDKGSDGTGQESH